MDLSVPIELNHRDEILRKELSQQEVVVLDFETTGLFPQRHRVIEVGAIIVRDQTVVNKFSSL
jgi:DNA polymerase III alpha subunit (gram-positive type)